MSEIRTDSLVNQSGDNDSGIDLTTNDVVAVKTADTERCRVDASGNLLVGTTNSSVESSSTDEGVNIFANKIGVARDGGVTANFNRLTSDGDIIKFRKDGTTRGAIGCIGDDIYIDGLGSSGSGIRFESNQLRPRRGGGDIDNSVDLGGSNFRFDDVFASNGTIQTSDANEKQQIASLTSAEITAAKAISALFKTYKWNSAVEAKGDAARTHTGVIAQQVETAMTDAGLDAGDYAFFISTDWYVDADGNEVDADAEGAIAKNRKGIRYPELLSFVGAATEQRLADIETRLTALENA
jgi:hypothetical protein